MVNFHFLVKASDWEGQFTEISGLNVEGQTLEYPDGDNANFSALKMTGIKKHNNISFKRGIIKDDGTGENFYAYLKKTTSANVSIALLNEVGKAVIIWTAVNAIVVKIIAPLTNTDNQITVEQMEMTHEGLSIMSVLR